MVIGRLPREEEGGDQPQAALSAWARVEAAQRDVRLPCLLTPQPAHAVLAGELAEGLVRFGPLPPAIKRAIQMHDTGWASSDAQQIQKLRFAGPGSGNVVPVSFVTISPGEAAEAWTASIDSVEALSKTGAIIVSRHFSLLAQQAHHQQFIQAERSRRHRLEASKAKSGERLKQGDLDRWTAALGFCDLVSLYLLSGLRGEVELPLDHPASPEAQTAPRVTMRVQGSLLHFTPATVRTGCKLSIQALRHPVPAQGPRAETLAWEVG